MDSAEVVLAGAFVTALVTEVLEATKKAYRVSHSEGAVSVASVGALVTEVVEEAKKAYRCKDYCKNLIRTLEAVEPLVVRVEQYSDKGDATCQAWLASVHALLVEAKGLTAQCAMKSSSLFVYVKKQRLSSSLAGIDKRIKDKFVESNLLTLSIVQKIFSGQCMVSDVADDSAAFEMQPVPSKIVAFEENPFKRLKEVIICAADALSGEGLTVGLKGGGGVGKTLLAKMVNNDKDIQQKYGAGSILMITIGLDASVSSVYKCMGWFLSGGTDVFGREYAHRSLEDQRRYLLEAFKERRTLLILDDVCESFYNNHAMIDWLDICKGCGSTTLITTRNGLVLDRAKAKERIEVLSLSKEESWKLFSYHAFDASVPPSSEFENIAKQICDECMGLPLALEVLGGTMWAKKDVRDWDIALHRLKRSESVSDAVDDELFHRLRLSYDKLGSEDTIKNIALSQKREAEAFSNLKPVDVILNCVADTLHRLSYEEFSEAAPHFFGNQCKVLNVLLLIADEILSKEKARTGFWPPLVLTELRRLVKLGKSLIQDCPHDELCHKAYLRQGARTQAFAETVKEIVWCMSVVRLYRTKGDTYFIQNPSMIMGEFSQARLARIERHLLQEAAAGDQNELQAAVPIWIQNHSCSAKGCGGPLSQHSADDPLTCLAAQLSARMSNGEGNKIGNVEADHTSVLWKTSQEVLSDGGKIGSGSFGTVFETMWLGDKYAKKVFCGKRSERFQKEIIALAKLNHPHIVNVSAYSDVVLHGKISTWFFLMEKMPGDLRAHMTTRMMRLRIEYHFSILASIDLMLQVSEAMCYVNSKGMVHRGLKALNILVKPIDNLDLCEEGFVIAKLADFGLATEKREETSYLHMTRNIGSRLWMAPEVFSANELDDERLLRAFPRQADVYSFGIVCSEILTGETPYEDLDYKFCDLYKLLTNSENPLRPKLPPNCPQNLASLIRQCWDTNPTERPTFEVISSRLRYLKGLFMVTQPQIISQNPGNTQYSSNEMNLEQANKRR